MLGLKKNPLDLPPEERVLKEFEEKLQVYQVEKSRVIAIAFTSKDATLAAAIPSEMANVYLSLQSGAKLDSNSEASRWLEPEIANLREKVREAEAKVALYRAESACFRPARRRILPRASLPTFRRSLHGCGRSRRTRPLAPRVCGRRSPTAVRRTRLPTSSVRR